MSSGRHRLASRHADLSVIQHASQLVTDLGVQLDRQLETENRPSERMRMLREMTNRITRAANDAVTAYARSKRALKTELERADADVKAVDALSERLEGARNELLKALEVASRRYPTPEAPTVQTQPAHE